MQNLKALQVRLPKDLWVFAKKRSIDREISFNSLIIDLLKQYKKKYDKRLINSNNTGSLHHQDNDE